MVKEFDRQVENLLQKAYHRVAGLSVIGFLEHISPLRDKVVELDVTDEVDLEEGRLPFVTVIKSDLVATEKAMSLVEREGKPGLVRLYPLETEDFRVIEGVAIPGGMAYLLVDIDRGKSSINIRPSDAIKIIEEEGRSPLTIDEGIAIVTQYPEFLMKNHCFSLLASRHAGDQRVPDIWINAEKKANLGWCWAGNPHTWLGSASCGNRLLIADA
ncbi:MAG: hypothetical protein A2147_00035 [Chloroflexi bacterium RBG_16_57_8]|nr:MAG: hypothetical protein A2147_00035 [Chloroflexi bacterium RBG_16_57_8]